MPPLAAIRVFEAAGRLEHFSRAGEELGMTQAAVSYQIRQLEAQIGQPLFLREHGRVRLTDTGRRLLPAISEAFANMRQAFADLNEASAGILAISAPVTFASTFLASALGRFQLEFPDLAVRLSPSNELVDLSRGEFDLAIRIGSGKWEGVRADFLYRDHFTPMCSPQFMETHAVTQPADLLRVERLGSDDRWWQQWFACAGISLPVSDRRGLLLDSQSQEAAAAEAGYGVALMAPYLWRQELASGRLVQPFEQVCLGSSSLWLVCPERRVGVRKIERFREWLHEEIARHGHLMPKEALEPPL